MMAVESFARGTVVDEVRLKGVNRPIKIYDLIEAIS